MTAPLLIALAQANSTVGDMAGNLAVIRRWRAEAARQGAHVVVFPELMVTGYPPEDLVLRPGFQRRAMEAVEQLAEDTADGGPAIITGGIWVEGGKLHNAAFLLAEGRIAGCQFKQHLPNYGVFDEARVFLPGERAQVWDVAGHKLGLIICEDTWFPDVAAELKAGGAQLLLSINASPFEITKAIKRREEVSARVTETGLPLLYLNLCGGQDDIVFDGGGFVVDGEGREMARLKSHAEDLGLIGWDSVKPDVSRLPDNPQPCKEEAIYRTLVLGLRDYVEKTRQHGVLLGLSGGIDSAVVAAIAVDALGAERVRGVLMPSKYTSDDSNDDALETARLLGIRTDTVSIRPGVDAFDAMLGNVFAGLEPNVAEENIQSRLRGNILMAISNKIGWIVLNTSNKSETAVGYTTLYGDMCGAYSVLKDVYKTQVYAIADWRNAQGRVIPERSITKAPTAELRENQKDSDSLPDYPVLDRILHALIEERLSTHAVVQRGFDREMVEKTNRLLYSAEYKRRQAPPGVKVTSMLFGRDWRYPIAQRYKN